MAGAVRQPCFRQTLTKSLAFYSKLEEKETRYNNHEEFDPGSG